MFYNLKRTLDMQSRKMLLEQGTKWETKTSWAIEKGLWRWIAREFVTLPYLTLPGIRSLLFFLHICRYNINIMEWNGMETDFEETDWASEKAPSSCCRLRLLRRRLEMVAAVRHPTHFLFSLSH